MDELLLEKFKFDNLDFEKQNKVYDIFKQSYEKATGTSWDKSKFRSRAENWLFFGDENGFVTVRPQRGGYYKLTGVAGGIKSILKGLTELQDMNVPVWGMMTPELSNILVNRYGYKKPSTLEAKIILKSIPPSAFGNVDYKLNKDGSVTFSYADIGEATKVFVANKQYFSNVRKMLLSMAKNKILSPFKKKNIDEERAVSIPYKTGLEKIFEYIKQYGWDNTYISFRDDVRVTEKNPNNAYNTPTGVYCYPVISYKNKVENVQSMRDFTRQFPYQNEKKYMHVFSIRDYSNVLFTSKDETPKLNKYVERIKQIYSSERYVEVLKICDDFIAGNYVGMIDGKKFFNVTHNFWLLLYDVEEKVNNQKNVRNLNHKVTILCNKIGVDGFVDDACSGSIHNAEACQAVFFRIKNIELDYVVIDAHANRSDIPVKIIKGSKYVDDDDDGRDDYTILKKYKKYLSDKLNTIVYDIDPDYKKQTYKKSAFWVKDDHGNYYFIDNKGNPSIKGIDVNDFKDDETGDVIRAAYFNVLTNRKDFYKVEMFGGLTGNPDRGLATIRTNEGTKQIIINKEGNPDLKGINLEKSDNKQLLLALYYNQRLNLPPDNQYSYIYPFGELFRDKKHTAAKLSYGNKLVIINKKGQQDISGINPTEISLNSVLAAYYNQKLKTNEFYDVRPFSDTLFDGKHTVAIYKRDGEKNTKIINVEGEENLDGLNIENANYGVVALTAYLNQKLGVNKFSTVYPFKEKIANPNYTIAVPVINGIYMIINKNGEYDITGIVPNDIIGDDYRAGYFNTLNNGVKKFSYVKKFGENTNNPNRAIAEKTNGNSIIIDEKGNENYEGINPAELTGNDSNEIRASLYNQKLDKDIYESVYDFGKYINNPDHALSTTTNGEYAIINKEGILDISGIDPRNIPDSDYLTPYFNQKAGEKKFVRVNVFGENTGDINHATARKKDGSDVIINVNGDEDYENVDVTKVGEKFRKNMINNLLGDDVYVSVSLFTMDFSNTPRAIAKYHDERKVLINKEGVPDISGIDPLKLHETLFLTTYINQKIGEEKFGLVDDFNDDEIAVALLAINSMPVFINTEGNIVKITNLNKINQKSSTELAAYFNGLIGNNKYKRVYPFNLEIDSMEYTIAKGVGNEKFIINKKGELVTGGIEPNDIYEDENRAVYINQILGKDNLYESVTRFDTEYTGNDNIAVASEEDGTKTFINKKGEPDVTGIDPKKIEKRSYLAAYFNTLLGELNPNGSPFSTVYQFGEYTGNKNRALARLKNGKEIVINDKGEKDLTDIDADTILNISDEIRASYINQLLGEDKYLSVYKFGSLDENPNIAYATLNTGANDFINKEGKVVELENYPNDFLHVKMNHKIGEYKYNKIYPEGQHLGNELGLGHHVATLLAPNEKGGTAYVIINTEGELDVQNINPLEIGSDIIRTVYFNQLLGKKIFRDVNPFYNGEAIARTENYENVTINNHGQIKNNKTGEFEDISKYFSEKSNGDESEKSDDVNESKKLLSNIISEILSIY
jgi:hypothetical protein